MGSVPLIGGVGVGLAIMALVGPRKVASKLRPRRPGLSRFLLTFVTGSISGAVSGAVIHFVMNYLHRIP